MDGFSKLMNVPGIYVKQKLELFEMLSGCETENKYVVFETDKEGEKLNT